MTRRLKIGIFMDSFYPAIDGVVLVIDNLAKELSKYNDVVMVVPFNSSYKDDKNRPYKVIRVNSMKLPTTEYRVGLTKIPLSKTYKKLLDEKFDVIHIHSPFTIGNLGIRIAKKCNIPVIGTFHTRYDFELNKRLKNELITNVVIKEIARTFNRCDKCIAINSKMIKVFKDYGYKGKPTIIYNGTDLLPLKNKKEACDKINKIFNFDENDNVLLFVGRITSIKNIFFILDSLKLLDNDNYNFKMLYVGEGADLKELERRIKEYKLEDKVIVTGLINDRNVLSSIYARANLFLFPSLFDASSLVQIEAAVNETPGLFIEGAVTADTVENGVSGYTCELDTEIYKNKIKEILDDKKELNKVAVNARKMLGKPWKDIAKETYNLYLEEIKKKSN